MTGRIIISDRDRTEDINRLRELVFKGNFGYALSQELKEDPALEKEYRKLTSDYPQAYRAFGKERRREALTEYRQSSYLEKMKRGLPNTDENRVILRELESPRHKMILMKLGYGGQGLGMKLHSLKARYPKACESFEREMEGLG